MSTAFYLYHIPSRSYGDWRTSIEECLKRKELIGVRTLEGKYPNRKHVFTFTMHPGNFMYEMHFYGEFHGVYEEGGRMMLLASFFEELKDMTIIKFDRDNIPS